MKRIFKGPWLWSLLAVVGVLLALQYFASSGEADEITTSEMNAYIASGEVSKLTFVDGDQQVKATLDDDVERDGGLEVMTYWLTDTQDEIEVAVAEQVADGEIEEYTTEVPPRGADAVVAVKRISERKMPFASRGDKSGTHAAELRLWKMAAADPEQGKGSWYRETGSGMGPTLNTASAMNAYALTDRGTWLSFKNRGDLAILVEGDQRLFNQYGVMLVNPARQPHVKRSEAMAFIDWVTSPEGQQSIADYKLGGEQLFFPNAKIHG